MLARARASRFDAVWPGERDRIWRLVARLAGDPDVADDLTQEVAVRALAGFALFRSRAATSTWLYRIAVNVVLRHRERKVLPVAAIDEYRQARADVGSGSHPETAAIALDRRQAVRAAVDRLPDEQRAVLILNIFEDLTYREIAAVLQIPEGTVKSRRHAATVLLRKDLHDYEL